MVIRGLVLAAVLLACVPAMAQSGEPGAGSPTGKVRTPKAHRKVTVPPAGKPASVDQTRNDIIRGSASQQELERNDAARAGWKPIDHSRDEFGSDFKF